MHTLPKRIKIRRKKFFAGKVGLIVTIFVYKINFINLNFCIQPTSVFTSM